MTLFLLLSPGWLVADPQPKDEYRIKAALLHKLSRFVQWPEVAFSSADAPLGICVLGKDPFGPALDTLRGLISDGRRIRVERSRSAEQSIGRCQILFIADSERPRLDALLKTLGHQPILSVSDIEGFARRGGILQMYTAATRIRFVINFGSVKRSGLRIASPLLDLAEIVGRSDGAND